MELYPEDGLKKRGEGPPFSKKHFKMFFKMFFDEKTYFWENVFWQENILKNIFWAENIL